MRKVGFLQFIHSDAILTPLGFRQRLLQTRLVLIRFRSPVQLIVNRKRYIRVRRMAHCLLYILYMLLVRFNMCRRHEESPVFQPNVFFPQDNVLVVRMAEEVRTVRKEEETQMSETNSIADASLSRATYSQAVLGLKGLSRRSL